MVRIFIADDHEVVRSGLKSLIARRMDWSVCGEATDGLETVSKCLAAQPDLIVMDISMPIMSGIQAARKIRELIPSAKVVLLSMHDPSSMPNVISSSGAHACISKTESNEKLMQTMNSVLRGEPNRTEPPVPPGYPQSSQTA